MGTIGKQRNYLMPPGRWLVDEPRPRVDEMRLPPARPEYPFASPLIHAFSLQGETRYAVAFEAIEGGAENG
jgi:hypothetical protein